MKTPNTDSIPLIEKLSKKLNAHRTVFSTYYINSDLDKFNEPLKLLDILSLPSDFLIGNAQEVYSFFESNDDLDEEIRKYYNDFKWKLSAFISIQDIFDVPFVKNANELNIFNLWYFYYESKYILIESIICGFNGLYLSTNILSRLFLEFNIIQNYFYRLINHESDYSKLIKYFKDEVLPSWNVVINGSLPKDNFCKPIKIRLDHHLKSLSKKSAHPYHPKFSPKQYSSFIPEHSIEGLFFWHGLDIALQAILWLYYVNFPMLFQKTRAINKFGFNGPVGLFADEQNVHIVKKTLSESDYKEFKNYSDNHEQVVRLLEWLNSMDDLSEQEILDTWNEEDGKISSVLEGYAKKMAKIRAMRELLALKIDKIKFPEISDDKIKKMLDYKSWKNIYKQITR